MGTDINYIVLQNLYNELKDKVEFHFNTPIEKVTKEETGYTANSMEHLISFTPTCGYSGERLHIYYCKGLTPGETNFDETEDLDIVEYSVNELIEMIKSGIIHDSKTIIGILYARLQGII